MRRAALLVALVAAGMTAEIYDLKTDPEETEDLFPTIAGKTLFRKIYSQYVERMSPLYQRYQEAETTEQPRFPFAVSAAHLQAGRVFNARLALSELAYRFPRSPRIAATRQVVHPDPVRSAR